MPAMSCFDSVLLHRRHIREDLGPIRQNGLFIGQTLALSASLPVLAPRVQRRLRRARA